MQLERIKVFECLVRQAQALRHEVMTLRIGHTLVQQTEQGFNQNHQRPQMLYELGLVNTTLIHDGFECPSP
jgi:hypothetical protein